MDGECGADKKQLRFNIKVAWKLAASEHYFWLSPGIDKAPQIQEVWTFLLLGKRAYTCLLGYQELAWSTKLAQGLDPLAITTGRCKVMGSVAFITSTCWSWCQ